MTLTIQAYVLAFMLVAGAAWGFVRLTGDAILGALHLSLWVRRKIVERTHDR